MVDHTVRYRCLFWPLRDSQMGRNHHQPRVSAIYGGNANNPDRAGSRFIMRLIRAILSLLAILIILVSMVVIVFLIHYAVYGNPVKDGQHIMNDIKKELK